MTYTGTHALHNCPESSATFGNLILWDPPMPRGARIGNDSTGVRRARPNEEGSARVRPPALLRKPAKAPCAIVSSVKYQICHIWLTLFEKYVLLHLVVLRKATRA